MSPRIRRALKKKKIQTKTKLLKKPLVHRDVNGRLTAAVRRARTHACRQREGMLTSSAADLRAEQRSEKEETRDNVRGKKATPVFYGLKWHQPT